MLGALIEVRGYRTDILNPIVEPHFDLCSWMIKLDFTEQGLYWSTLPWPTCSPDLYLIEHLWEFRQRNPPIQTVVELETALH